MKNKSEMQFIPVKTNPLLPPKDNIFPVLDTFLPKLRDGDVLLITSKILAIHQGRCTPVTNESDKRKLVAQEADLLIRGKKIYNHYIPLTIKENILIPSAGIDESNGNGYWVLWPKSTEKLLKKIWQHLRKKYRIKNLGVIATDSHTSPLRRGVTGIATSSFGIEPLRNYKQRLDIFKRKLKYTEQNVVDNLASAAVFLMGEGNETTPLVIARNVRGVQFTNKQVYKQTHIKLSDDIYYPLLSKFKSK